MKTKSILSVMFGALACAMVVSSCINDDIQTANNQAVRFSSSIGQLESTDEAPGTRASGTEWDGGDAIGVYMVTNKTTTVVMNAENKQYVVEAAGANGAFSPAVGNEIYYPQAGSVNFIAYYPWTATSNIVNNLYPVNVATQSDLAAIDLLWATATGTGDNGYDKNNTSPIALEFSHQLTKLILNTTAGAGLSDSDLTGMTITIKGMNTENTFNVKTAEFGTAKTIAPINPKTITNGVQYEAIILEREVENDGDVTVEFKLANSDADLFVWNVPAGTKFNSGEEHTWNITIKRTGVSVTGTIKPWTDGAGGSDVAE